MDRLSHVTYGTKLNGRKKSIINKAAYGPVGSCAFEAWTHEVIHIT